MLGLCYIRCIRVTVLVAPHIQNAYRDQKFRTQ